MGPLGTRNISGTLCKPADGAGDLDQVQILIPGSTYDSSYWDFPAPGYSYAEYAANKGHATFAMDRFNTGKSDRLPSAAVTVLSDASNVHEIASQLRSGKVDGNNYSKIVTVGHSLGSIIAVQEAAQYQDVDGVILSGFTHSPSLGFIANLAAGRVLQPAPYASDQLSNQPIGDLGADLESRKRNFYGHGDYDPDIIKKDHEAGSVITAGELATFPVPDYGPQSAFITAPVLIANGSQDAVFFCSLGLQPCGSPQELYENEKPRFPSTSLDTWIQGGAGHSNNLAESRMEFFEKATNWIDSTV